MDVDQSKPPLPDQSSDANYGKIQAARKEALEQQLKASLGDERYAEYTRSQDGNFQQVYRLTERYNLPRETAIKVYEIQQSTTKLADDFHKSKDLSEDELMQALSVLQQEARRNVTEVLGEDAAKTYQKYGGGWLDNSGEK